MAATYITNRFGDGIGSAVFPQVLTRRKLRARDKLVKKLTDGYRAASSVQRRAFFRRHAGVMAR